MHDLKRIADAPDEARAQLELRGNAPDLDPILRLNERRKELIQAYDSGRHRQRELSDAFRQKDGDADSKAAAREELKGLGAELKSLEQDRTEVENQIRDLLLLLPNFPSSSVPKGSSEEDNVVVRTWGEPGQYSFDPKDHVDVGEGLGILDMEGGARISGARFALYRGAGSQLERALMMFMLDLHTSQHGYEEVFTPFLVLRECMVGTGQLPKFEDDAFATRDGLFLIPTAEVPVTNLLRESIQEPGAIPQKYCAYSSCFRREAGSTEKIHGVSPAFINSKKLNWFNS
jgi:seryl-tRNA synthetase